MAEPDAYQYCPYDASLLDHSPQEHDGLPFCRRCGFVNYQNPRPCVAVAIFDSDRQLLLARRAIDPQKGEWDFPGGFIAPNETAEEAVVRETREETTLEVRVVEYLGSVPDVYGDGGIPTLNFCFAVEVISGVPTPKSDVAELRWFSLYSLPDKMAFRHQSQVLEWCRAKTTADLQDSAEPTI